MMTAEGHEVYLYAGDQNIANANLVTCITKAEQDVLLSVYDWYRDGMVYAVDWDDALPFWQVFLSRAMQHLQDRVERGDIICLPTGWPMRQIADSFPQAIVCESGVGYENVYTKYRVFESYAWMHTVYGKDGPSRVDGRFYDAVIPNFFEVKDFPAKRQSEPYFLFMSRMIERKGYQIAIDTTRELGMKLVVAGVGGARPEADHVEYVGYADACMRGHLMANAEALFAPTLYLEPFGGVVAESLLTGTPVITTDWGAFPELVKQGKDGFRCRTMREFVDAARNVGTLDSRQIREDAIARFSTEAVGPQYTAYFGRLSSLWGEGFYAGLSR